MELFCNIGSIALYDWELARTLVLQKPDSLNFVARNTPLVSDWNLLYYALQCPVSFISIKKVIDEWTLVLTQLYLLTVLAQEMRGLIMSMMARGGYYSRKCSTYCSSPVWADGNSYFYHSLYLFCVTAHIRAWRTLTLPFYSFEIKSLLLILQLAFLWWSWKVGFKSWNSAQ